MIAGAVHIQAAVSLSVEQLVVISEEVTAEVLAASPEPIAHVGTVLRHTHAIPSQTVDEIAAMVDVSTEPSDADCFAADVDSDRGGDDSETRCVSVKLRVWERVRAPAVVSNEWWWVTEANLANMNLYKWEEVVAEAPDGLVLMSGGCYYMTASVYERGDNGAAEIAVETLRPVELTRDLCCADVPAGREEYWSVRHNGCRRAWLQHPRHLIWHF